MESREPRCATVTAVTPVSALRLDVDSCNVLLGPLEDLLRRAAPAGAGAKGSSRVFGVIKKSDLQTLGLLGCGGFGAVYLVEQACARVLCVPTAALSAGRGAGEWRAGGAVARVCVRASSGESPLRVDRGGSEKRARRLERPEFGRKKIHKARILANLGADGTI